MAETPGLPVPSPAPTPPPSSPIVSPPAFPDAHHVIWGSVTQLTGTVGELRSTCASNTTEIASLKSRVKVLEDLKNKVVGGAIAIAALAGVVGAAVTWVWNHWPAAK